ncbi:TRAP transporter large permease subunit [bacterium]|nr:TRAP transporter large permease subunit [bacterium]
MLLFSALPDTSITGAANDVFSEKFADSPLLVTIPLFTFAGYLMAESGTPRRLVAMSRAWVGWMPGGLAVVCILASAFFTTFTGGSGITIVAIGGLLYPALLADNYDEKFSLGLVTTSGSLGLLFPPSLPIVLYGVVAGVMIERLFLAGILPGILTVGALALYAVSTGVRHKMKRTPFNARAAFKALWEGKWEVMLPVVLLAGLYLGWLRIHEAAAFTAIYVLVIEVFVYRDITFRRDLPRVIRESMTLVGAILAILTTAIGFTAYLIQAQVPMKILDAMSSFISSPVMFLLGASFAQFVVTPLAMQFFLGFADITSVFAGLMNKVVGGVPTDTVVLPETSSGVTITFFGKVNESLDITLKFIIAFGLCFQLPVLLTLMGKAGLVSSQGLGDVRKYAVVAILLLAALVTPPDVVTQLILFVVVYGLYEVSIQLVKRVEKTRDARLREEGLMDDEEFDDLEDGK